MKSSSGEHLEGSKMHILALVVTVMSVAAIWYWRVKALHEIGTDVVDAAGRARGAYRRFRFRQKAESSVLASVDDPALAAAILFFAMAREGGLTPAAEAEIRRQVSLIAAAHRLDEILIYAAWAANQVSGPNHCLRQFKPLWRSHLTLAERQQLVAMAKAVGRTTVAPARPHHFAVDTLSTALSLGEP